MKPLTRTRHRLAVMQLVLDGMIFALPGRKAWQQAGELAVGRAESRALGELLDAGLIRRSVVSRRAGDGKGVRLVFPTDCGRMWAAIGYRAKRGCSNTNERGNAKARRVRKQWLLDTYGNGKAARCWLAVQDVCVKWVTFETLTVERVTPGHKGGTYRRENIKPACGPCQSYQGGRIGQERLRAARDLNS